MNGHIWLFNGHDRKMSTGEYGHNYSYVTCIHDQQKFERAYMPDNGHIWLLIYGQNTKSWFRGWPFSWIIRLWSLFKAWKLTIFKPLAHPFCFWPTLTGLKQSQEFQSIEPTGIELNVKGVYIDAKVSSRFVEKILLSVEEWMIFELSSCCLKCFKLLQQECWLVW